MSRTLIPKRVGLSSDVLEKVKKEFNLSDANINDIEYWSGPQSPYAGTIINTNPVAQYLCYPCTRSEKGFLDEYDDGEIWEPKS
ncbi:MAG: hypothetical protein WCK59_04655 [Candidatus Falkowbacteria bacterium]